MRINEIEDTFEVLKVREIPEIDFQSELQNCQKAANSFMKLYRGTSDIAEPFIFGEIRQNRIPVSSGAIDVETFNGFMAYNKWPFRKENTLSVSSDPKQGQSYARGTLGFYQIFPYDDALYFKADIRDLLDLPYHLINSIQGSKAFVNGWQASGLKYPEWVAQVPELFKACLDEVNEKFKEHYKIIVTNDPSQLRVGRAGEILVHGTNYIGKILPKVNYVGWS